MPKWAHRPSMLLNGDFFVVSAAKPRGVVVDFPLLLGRQRPNHFQDGLFNGHKNLDFIIRRAAAAEVNPLQPSPAVSV